MRNIDNQEVLLKRANIILRVALAAIVTLLVFCIAFDIIYEYYYTYTPNQLWSMYYCALGCLNSAYLVSFALEIYYFCSLIQFT